MPKFEILDRMPAKVSGGRFADGLSRQIYLAEPSSLDKRGQEAAAGAGGRYLPPVMTAGTRTWSAKSFMRGVSQGWPKHIIGAVVAGFRLSEHPVMGLA